MRRIPVVLAAIAVAALLAGCTGSSGSLIKLPASGSTTPTVGQCWTVDYDAAQKDATWEGSSAVSCTQPHQAYTYAVVKIESNEKAWASSDGTEDTVISNSAYQACEAKSGKLMAKIDSYRRVLQHYFYLPSESEWKAGARWVRCDVGLIKLGSYYNAPTLGDLPDYQAILKEIVSDPERLMTCVNTTDATGAAGPLDDENATYVDCTQSPQWTFHADILLPGDAKTEYPGDDAINAQAAAQCDTPAETAGVKSLAYVPGAQDWSDGDRYIECWFYRAIASGQTNT